MTSKLFTILAAVAATFGLSSCSGSGHSCTTNCGGGGNGTMTLTLSDTPPAGVTVLSFLFPIAGISLTPSTGSQVSIFSGATFELTRLQSDTSAVATAVPVPAGTYTAINVTVGTSSGVFYNASAAAVGSCAAGAVCDLPAGAATTINIPINLTISGNGTQWVGLEVNLNNAITTAGGITVDFTQANVMTATTTAPTGNLPNGAIANIDDFTGAITILSNSSITLKSTVRGSLTASISSSTPVHDPQSQCTGGGSITCVGVGSIVSLQGVMNSAGVITATSLDVIDKSTTPADEAEGTVYPATCNGGSNYSLILNDSVIFNNTSPFASANFGQPVCLTLAALPTFAIDTGILTGQAGVSSTNGFTTSTDILAGQNIRAMVTGAATGVNGINATATTVILRFSRLSGTVKTGGSSIFTITGLPAYITAFATSPQVATYPNATVLEGATSISSLVSPQPVSITALFLNPTKANPPLQAAKVRAH
jgi:hypothetical protein